LSLSSENPVSKFAFKVNVYRYIMGAVNGAFHPGGEPDESNLQSQEVWTGISYALASHLMLSNLTDEAWETARGVARVTYDGGFAFRTPEAWDAFGNFRAAMYQRPGAVWALEHALVMKHKREVRAAAAAAAAAAGAGAAGDEAAAEAAGADAGAAAGEGDDTKKDGGEDENEIDGEEALDIDGSGSGGGGSSRDEL
jgi:hypothetical protein